MKVTKKQIESLKELGIKEKLNPIGNTIYTCNNVSTELEEKICKIIGDTASYECLDIDGDFLLHSNCVID